MTPAARLCRRGRSRPTSLSTCPVNVRWETGESAAVSRDCTVRAGVSSGLMPGTASLITPPACRQNCKAQVANANWPSGTWFTMPIKSIAVMRKSGPCDHPFSRLGARPVIAFEVEGKCRPNSMGAEGRQWAQDRFVAACAAVPACQLHRCRTEMLNRALPGWRSVGHIRPVERHDRPSNVVPQALHSTQAERANKRWTSEIR